jgi:transaldolase
MRFARRFAQQRGSCMAHPVLEELSALGVALWLDDLDRGRLQDGSLADLIEAWSVRGVTTNPAIFQKAIATGPWYAKQIADLRGSGRSVSDIVWDIAIDDVQAACDLFKPVWERTDKIDGRVSIEVDPRLAHDTEATIDQAEELWRRVDRPNALIKIPATPAGIPAITAAIARGISVNVTLIFSVERYREVSGAYLTGLQQAHASGFDLSTITSVASFFVSRVDSEVDQRIARAGLPDELRGRAAIANARLAWAAYQETLASPRWLALAELGAREQRPLWASTGVKDSRYDPTRYVIDLAVPGCVNTVPEPTLQVVATQGVYRGDQVSGEIADARDCFTQLKAAGIDMTDVFATLESEGVDKFIAAWNELLAQVGLLSED